ncbi:Pogo transposable element with KRAB domainlike [Phytophthora palmivora]|uniref:Pogo transposable element with KRAB domainlike n=1 Tax=Phytophthora palmivora TaxID=4796 RepID=A0A2P4X6V0_9STRA|nr:Pogo transposable element with KRAB domainlike [Phytophthora palmivora]
MNEGKHLVWDSMRAHISKDLKAKCSTRNNSILAPYLEAGDITIYKTFKDMVYIKINAWKESDKVEYTRFGNPRMASVAVVYSRTVNISIGATGFGDDYMEWHVAQHDEYGEKFCEKWGDADATQEVSATSSNLGVT